MCVSGEKNVQLVVSGAISPLSSISKAAMSCRDAMVLDVKERGRGSKLKLRPVVAVLRRKGEVYRGRRECSNCGRNKAKQKLL